MDLKDKSVLLTGFGFVGKHLAPELIKRGAKLTVLDKDIDSLVGIPEGVNVLKSNLRHLTQKMEFDYVMHLASLTSVSYCETNYAETFESNTLGTINLLKNVKINERFIFTSSAVVYGNQNQKKYDESMTLHPISDYGVSKALAESAITNYAKKLNYKYTICRFFNLYGEGQTEIYIVPQIILEALKKRKITIWNDLSSRDFIYVKDAVEALLIFAENQAAENQIVNIGSGKGTTIGQLSNDIKGLIDKDIEIVNKNIFDKASPLSLTADVEKAKRLGFSAKTSTLVGLRNTIEYYNQKVI
jgi:UDP-glucose 4-epimerase